MANKNKGEVTLMVGDMPYTVRFSANALCELEDDLGMGVNSIAQQMANPELMRIRTLIAILWAGLKDRQVNITRAEASEILTEVGLTPAMESISEAFKLAFRKVDDDTPPIQPDAETTRPGQAVMTGTG